MNCDWFVRDDEVTVVLLKLIEHSESNHRKEFSAGVKDMGFSGVYKFWLGKMHFDK